MQYTVAAIEALRKLLLEQPDADDAERTVNKREAVKLLASAVAQLQRRGYSLKKIAEMLAGGGLTISVPSLKSYLSRSGGGSAKRKRRLSPRQLPAPSSAPISLPPVEKSSLRPAAATQVSSKPQPPVVDRAGSFVPREDSADI